MTDDEPDYASNARHRRQRWYGAKPVVKRALAHPVVHTLIRPVSLVLGDRIRRERLPAPATVKDVTARMAGVEFVMRRPDRCIIAKELYWGNGRRPRAGDQLALDVFAALARPANLVLDIGAYTGVFSLLAARVSPAAQVHAYEVVPAVVEAALENVAANGLSDRVTVHGLGLGADGDQVRIPSGTGGSALPDFYSTRERFADGVEVDIQSLDAATSKITESPPALLKIDVEGSEDRVLAGGGRFLTDYRPDILCEVLIAEADPAAIQRVLDPLGYRYFRVEQDALRPHPALTPTAEFRDWLFTTRPDEDLAALGIVPGPDGHRLTADG